MFATNQGVVLTAALAITPGLDVLQTNAGEGETARYAVVQGEQLHLVLAGQAVRLIRLIKPLISKPRGGGPTHTVSQSK